MRSTALVALAVASVPLIVGCKGDGRPLVAPPVQANGVRVDLLGVKWDHEDMDVDLRVYNQLPFNITLDRNTVALVLPTGQELRRDGGDPYRVVRPGHDNRVNVHFVSSAYDFRNGPGFWLRFDGVYMGDQRIAVPPMALAQPSQQAGTPQEYPIPQRALEAYAETNGDSDSGGGLIGAAVATVRNTVARVTGGEPAEEPAKPKKSSGLEQYRGPRQQIKQPHTKVAAMPLKTSDVPDEVAFIMNELLLTELQSVGFEAIGPDDINAMVGFENMKDQMSCDDASCVAEIGNALGVPYLTAGNIANLDGTTVLTLKLIDVKNTTVVARVSKLADGGTKVLPRVIAEAVQEMVLRSGL